MFHIPVPPTAIVCPAPVVTDGDSIRCGKVRLRLLGIDAPEMHACPKYRVCVPGDPAASRAALQAAVSAGPITYRPLKTDRYGRLIALVWAGSTNLSCWQLRGGHAQYIAKWDIARRVYVGCHLK